MIDLRHIEKAICENQRLTGVQPLYRVNVGGTLQITRGCVANSGNSVTFAMRVISHVGGACVRGGESCTQRACVGGFDQTHALASTSLKGKIQPAG